MSSRVRLSVLPSPAATRALHHIRTLLANDSLGLKSKVENKGQYEQYLEELKSLREELGVPLKEDLYPEAKN